MSTLSRKAAGHVWLISRTATKQVGPVNPCCGCGILWRVSTQWAVVSFLRRKPSSQHGMKETSLLVESQGMRLGHPTVTASFHRFSRSYWDAGIRVQISSELASACVGRGSQSRTQILVQAYPQQENFSQKPAGLRRTFSRVLSKPQLPDSKLQLHGNMKPTYYGHRSPRATDEDPANESQS